MFVPASIAPKTETHTTATRQLAVLTEPATIAEAYAARDDQGKFGAIVIVAADDMFGPDIDFDHFYDTLLAQLVTGSIGVNCDRSLEGLSSSGRYLYVWISTDIACEVRERASDGDEAAQTLLAS